ncbi:cytochrome P450 [Didymella exigua CBS 183.55]|uniref:Cytochrome P450 n=1 Tax=Didymella exigua CBS 183.55 TaxID=1150837 RepID=A0A6A5R4Z8_9PLEO|nr:cytochrome P450 [Didymella exigua CBS 183.55]KAF1922218.1 cytochrome P450 [Didymella exigua CBS 183.55]
MKGDRTDSLFTLPVIIATIATYWIVAVLYSSFTAPQPPTSVPWQGGKGWIAGLRNFFALTKSKDWLAAGYEKYSKNDKAFVLPAVFSAQAELVLPRSQLNWMFDQPDHVLSTNDAHYDLLQGDYAFVKPIILRDPYHEHVIHKNLVRNLNAIIPDLEEEVPPTVDAVYGTDIEFRKIDLMKSFMTMIPRLTNRMMVGPTLCCEQKFLDAVLSFTTDVVGIFSFLPFVPRALHPLIGNLVGLTSKYHYWLASRFTLPLIKQRLENIRRKDKGDPDYKDWKEPRDFITWSYRTAQAEGRTDEMQPARIAQRIMPLNFAAIHTTSLTAYETMINILSASPSVIEGLREEASRVLEEEGSWTKKALARMHRMDSAIRESQRVSPIALTFVARKVVAKEGVITPEGVHVGCGTIISCPWTPIAHDEELHSGSLGFDAFRYSRAREEFDTMCPDQRKKVDTLKLKQTGLVTTSNQHLPFGHGRHACPGRFFVSHELKMIFAHLLLNYDFKPLKEKPKKLFVARTKIPLPAIIEFKRRKSVWQKPAQ